MSYLKKYNISRTLVFDTLAHALASNRVFGYWERAVIKGDNTRYKIGDGIKYSGDGTLPFVGSTFAQLPWIYAAPGIGNAVAINATATITASQLKQRYITTTSVAAETLTLPTVALMVSGGLVAGTQGEEFDFEVDNSAGANTVTIAVGTGTTAATPVITGGATLTVAAGTFGKFKLIFKSPTAALLFRTL